MFYNNGFKTICFFLRYCCALSTDVFEGQQQQEVMNSIHMLGIHMLFNNYGWTQINTQAQAQAQKIIYIKNKHQRLDEFTVEENSDNTFNISIPISNSEFLYKNTIHNIQDTISYIELHLNILQQHTEEY